MADSSFASDNAAGVHPEVVSAIERANRGCATAYGRDDWTAEATSHLRRHFGAAAEPLLVFGGTGANVVALAPLGESFQSVVCADTSHLWNDECAAPEHFLGAKLVPVPTEAGKLGVDSLRRAVPDRPAAHHAQPRVLSIAQPTELGTLYTLAELEELTSYARDRGWRVHVDGARLANAAAALELPFGAFGADAGVDALSFGGTKNGALCADAVLLFDGELARRAQFYRKQATQLPSKMRFVAAQLTAQLEGDLWRRCAGHANQMARRLEAALAPLARVDVAYPVETNAVFVRMPAAAAAALLQQYDLVPWDPTDGLVRAMTSWATEPDDVDRFAAAVAQIAS